MITSIFYDTLKVVGLAPQSGNNTTLNGPVIDLINAQGIEFECAVGAIDSTVTFKVQTGTLENGSDMIDVPGLSIAFTATDDNKPGVLTLDLPLKPYARLVAVLGNGTAQLVSSVALIYGYRGTPTTQAFGAFKTGV